jgi:hypothetical protein
VNVKKLSSILIIVVGCIELSVACLHFIWPFNFLQSPDFNNITSSFKDFILLATISLGLCMVVFACMSFYFSKRIMFGEKSALVFCLLQSVLWIFRLIFEIVIPVKVSFYSIDNLSELIIVMAIVIIIINLIPVILLRKGFQLTSSDFVTK